MTSHNCKEGIYKSHHISIWLAFQLVLTKVMNRAMPFFFFFAWAVVKARQISGAIKQKILTILTTCTAL